MCAARPGWRGFNCPFKPQDGLPAPRFELYQRGQHVRTFFAEYEAKATANRLNRALFTPEFEVRAVRPQGENTMDTPRDKLKAWMTEMGLLDIDVAAALRIYPASFTNLRTGKRSPSLELAAKIERLTDGRIMAAEWVTGIKVKPYQPEHAQV